MSAADDPRFPPAGALFTVSYGDEVFFFAEGGWARFGRDDEQCQITVWEELRGISLSRVAGELWCAEGEMWVRNVSGSHELTVTAPTGAPQTLPPREEGTRGRACSVPGPEAVVAAPSTGSWHIGVRTLAAAAGGGAGSSGFEGVAPGEGSTTSVEPPPQDLAAVAAALCAPVVLDGGAPASYDEVAATLDISRRHARRKVEQLCDHYRAQVPDLLTSYAREGQASYVPVALLLVDRGRIGRDDVRDLGAAADAWGAVEGGGR
ncbi:hypothetical protein CLV92_11351 [Kineococcus xinjiangensis]|uniref:Uncharacterized protein n=1 Tax=Kineococcus xinjiangensis TaxID=512762 RepID=A0A2S6IEI0_9ACTN|nr:hypothetical protein [Kineococcus xinjiangensis]PPK92622.1 hypothetical protein CLV92_11351 [Kineococcus xinjiangensis]